MMDYMFVGFCPPQRFALLGMHAGVLVTVSVLCEGISKPLHE
jgi:hypothetical protein